MKKAAKIISVLFVIVIGWFIFYCSSIIQFTEEDCKMYIIDHVSRIEKTDSVNYEIGYCHDPYFTDITIRLLSDSAYQVVFWGDRNSWQWRFRSDESFTVSIPYLRDKGYDVRADIYILKTLNKLK